MLMDRDEIQKYLPHRGTMLLLDTVEELDTSSLTIKGKKFVKEDELLTGHFPGRPMFPGVLMIESLAQLGGVLVMSLEQNKDKLSILTGVDGARIRRMVTPNETLDLSVQIDHLRKTAGTGKGKATVNGKTVCEAKLTFVLIEK